MYVITIRRKELYISICSVLCILAILIFLFGFLNKKMDANVYLTSSDSIGDNTKNIEVFDISKGSVVSHYEPSPVFQREAIRYLKAITGVYPKLNLFPSTGFIMKIPLNPPIPASGEWLASTNLEYIDKIYVIFPMQSEPYLLILDKQSNPLCFRFEANTSTLREYFNEPVTTYK